jgi:hypothetical protein
MFVRQRNSAACVVTPMSEFTARTVLPSITLFRPQLKPSVR